MPLLGRLWCWVWEELCTCCSAGRDGESCQWLVADIMAVDQEAGQVLHSIKLPFQHFLSPLTHQVAGCKANILLNTAQLADTFSDVTLLRGQKRGLVFFILVTQLVVGKWQRQLLNFKRIDSYSFCCFMEIQSGQRWHVNKRSLP